MEQQNISFLQNFCKIMKVTMGKQFTVYTGSLIPFFLKLPEALQHPQEGGGERKIKQQKSYCDTRPILFPCVLNKRPGICLTRPILPPWFFIYIHIPPSEHYIILKNQQQTANLFIIFNRQHNKHIKFLIGISCLLNF